MIGTSKINPIGRVIKTGLVLILIFTLMGPLVGCGTTASDSSATTSAAPKATTAAGAAAQQETTAPKETEKLPVAVLSGQELVDDLMAKVVFPERILIEGTSTAEGMTVETKTYIYKDFLRYESTSTQGEQIMIYNPDEGVTYMYSLADGTGVIYRDGEDEDMDDEDMELDVSTDWTEAVEGLVSAELTTLNGQEVLYIETQNHTGEGMYTQKQWISVEFWHPIKTEGYFDAKLMHAYEVTKLDKNFDMRDDLFEPPTDITFMDMDDLFEGLMDNLGGED